MPPFMSNVGDQSHEEVIPAEDADMMLMPPNVGVQWRKRSRVESEESFIDSSTARSRAGSEESVIRSSAERPFVSKKKRLFCMGSAKEGCQDANCDVDHTELDDKFWDIHGSAGIGHNATASVPRYDSGSGNGHGALHGHGSVAPDVPKSGYDHSSGHGHDQSYGDGH